MASVAWFTAGWSRPAWPCSSESARRTAAKAAGASASAPPCEDSIRCNVLMASATGSATLLSCSGTPGLCRADSPCARFWRAVLAWLIGSLIQLLRRGDQSISRSAAYCSLVSQIGDLQRAQGGSGGRIPSLAARLGPSNSWPSAKTARSMRSAPSATASVTGLSVPGQTAASPGSSCGTGAAALA